MNYWRVMGTLYDDNRLVLRHGYLDTRPRATVHGESRLHVCLYDDEDRLLATYPLALHRNCGDIPTETQLAVRGWVPFPDRTRAIRFMLRDIVIHYMSVTERVPTLELLTRLEGEISGVHMLRWSARHPDGLPLEYFCRYSSDDGRTWQRVGWRTRESAADVDFNEMPGGSQCRIAVVATDGVNTTIEGTGPFRVAIKDCRALILAPRDGERLSVGHVLALRGQGYYLEEHQPEFEQLRWSSSRDGDLGRGSSVECKELSRGAHEIVLEAGREGRTGRSSVKVYYE